MLGVKYGKPLPFYLYALDTFTAFTPLVGHQEEHPVCKKFSDDVMAWLSV